MLFRSACGAIGCVTNGPSRDVHEIRPMNFQYLTRGVCAGHGPQAVHAVQVPVSIAGMDVAPGTPEEFARYIRSETVKWEKVVKAAGLYHSN